MLAEEKFEKSESSESTSVPMEISPVRATCKTSIDFLDQFDEEVKKIQEQEKIEKKLRKERKSVKKLDKIASELAKMECKAKLDYEKTVTRIDLLQKEMASTGSSDSSRTVFTNAKQEKKSNVESSIGSPDPSDSIESRLNRIDKRLDLILYQIGKLESFRTSSDKPSVHGCYEIQYAKETVSVAISNLEKSVNMLKDLEEAPVLLDGNISRQEIQYLKSQMDSLAAEYKQSMTPYGSIVKEED